MFSKSWKLYSKKNFLGQKHSSKKEFAWITYEEVNDYSICLAKAIIERELYIKENRLRLFGVCSQSCPEATLLDFATLHADITSVSIDYGLWDVTPYNSEESLLIQSKSQTEKFKSIWEETKINALFGSINALKTVIRMKNQGELNCIKSFICFEELSEELTKDVDSIEGLEAFCFNKVINYGSELNIDVPRPSKESTFTVVFDSEAKIGSKISHHMLWGPIGSIWRKGFILESDDVYLSYHPLTTIFDKVCIIATAYVGGSIGYSSRPFENISDDMKLLWPTFYYCTSKMMLNFYKDIQSSISKKTRVVAKAIEWALYSKAQSFKNPSWLK